MSCVVVVEVEESRTSKCVVGSEEKKTVRRYRGIEDSATCGSLTGMFDSKRRLNARTTPALARATRALAY